MERIKDFLYDISDIVVSLLIIAAIFSVVTWKISTSLDIPEVNIAKSNNTLILENDPVTEDKNLIDVITVDNSEGVENNDSSSNIKPESIVEKDTDISSTSDAKPDPSDSTNNISTTTNDAKTSDVKTIEINIKSGTSGYGIAKILKSKDLIDDTTVFIKRVEELSLGMSLRAGDFTLKTDMTLDEMIHVLAGK